MRCSRIVLAIMLAVSLFAVVGCSSAGTAPTSEEQASKNPDAGVPQLLGWQFNAVPSALDEASLKLGTITYKKVEGYGPGTVIGQKPAAGSVVKKGTKVDFIVSK